MSGNYSQERYLAAKRTVDDRALNRNVLDAFETEIREATTIVEVGAGIGTMLQRLIEWDRLPAVEELTYTLVDVDGSSLTAAIRRLPEWADDRDEVVAVDTGVDRGAGGNQVTEGDRTADDDRRSDRNRVAGETGHGACGDRAHTETVRLETDSGVVTVRAISADAMAFLADADPDAVIGCAFLDLLREPAVDELFARLPAGCLCYFPITFDGVTLFEPPTRPDLDDRITERYHADMRRRANPGDPHAGRRLVTRATRDHDLLAAGSADWVVAPGLEDAPPDGYPADEAYFLGHIVETVRGALADDPAMDDDALAEWVADRHADIDAGRLIYLAHQLDVLLRVGGD
ncbi:hypothetical protein [Halorubrum vacuolatum]|uniref:Methyltransferase domain-containing protein n=1 Tax=Halorubrum vacuolatum TaxID=63740 RepID=A0A238XC14_HALVU|nr:hypothetical protein [Halorubrum vacuolatum]SNR56073.1 hypothetical protein SAMN06264855_11560 [Halorubrum vacuolatum]